MNFIKSVFSEDATPPGSPPESPKFSSDDQSSAGSTTMWSFGGLVKTLATKSETVIETYRQEFQEFGSGLIKETAIIREAASRAVKDLPASLEVGASVAQESLESVGQAIDDIGATVWKSTAQIVSHGKGSNLASESESDLSNNDSTSYRQQNLDVKRYSRFDMQVRALQCNLSAYCTEPEDRVEYEKWRSDCFAFSEKKEEIEDLFNGNRVIREIYDEVVPSRVDDEGFWTNYFYRVYKLKQAEEARALLVKRAISGEEEEDDFSWGSDEEEEENGNGNVNKKSSWKGESSGIVEQQEKSIESLNVPRGESSGKVEQAEKLESLSVGVDEIVNLNDENDKGKMAAMETKRDTASESSCKDSDVTVVSSQSLLPEEEEDLGWDNIEDIGRNDENKEVVVGNRSRIDLHRALMAADEEEELGWDIEG